MVIREYTPADERGWLRCRVVSFLDCGYWNDVKTAKETYSHPSVSLVAEDHGQIIGLIDVELDSDDLSYTDRGRGAVLWHMAVLPEYRRQGAATRLWQEAEKRLLAAGVQYCELWTQEDEAANRFYQAIGFEQQIENTWIRCYAGWADACKLLDQEKIGSIYGAEELVFQAAPERKEELKAICYRVDEVRLYAKVLLHEVKPNEAMRWNSVKKTVRNNIKTAYSLHDMNVIAFEVRGNDVTMRLQSGMEKTTPPYKQVDGFVEFHDLDWDYCFTYLMSGCGNIGKFTGEKLYFRDFIKRFPCFGFEVIDEVFGYNQTKLWGFLSVNREVCDCVIELYHLGDMVYVAEE